MEEHHTPGGPDDDIELEQHVAFLHGVFPNFETKVITKVLEEHQNDFEGAFKHLQEFFELVKHNEDEEESVRPSADDDYFSQNPEEEKKDDDDPQELSNELILVSYV